MIHSNKLNKFTSINHVFCQLGDISTVKEIITSVQIHGNSVTLVDSLPKGDLCGFDGLITRMKNIPIGVKTADCLPVLFYDPSTEIIAAVHAGWKGLVSGILTKTVNNIKDLGADLKKTVVAIGPHIRSCCYGVSFERIRIFENLYPRKAIGEIRKGSWYLNMQKVALIQLENGGVLRSNTDLLEICTCCNENMISYRRMGKDSGRMLSYVSLN